MRTKRFGFLVFPGCEELDLVGPWQMAALWKAYADGPQNLHMVGQTAEPLTCAKGMILTPHVSFADCPPLDYLLVPGGFSVFEMLQDEGFISFLKSRGMAAEHVLSVCSGSFLLHKAGLLDGRKATTNWKVLDQFEALPGVTLVEERIVRDSNIWTSGGVAAGIDLVLALIADVAGRAAAGIVQRHGEYYPPQIYYAEPSDIDQRVPSYFKSLGH
ncbi:MAG: DJ-1/PfpI family protein [Pseudomonadota bacterium]